MRIAAVLAFTLSLLGCGGESVTDPPVEGDQDDSAASAADAGSTDEADDDMEPAMPGDDVQENCPPERPISIGGDIRGYPDDFSINAVIGVHLVDASGRSVDGSGHACSPQANNCNGASNYAYFIRANPTVSPLGLDPSVPGQTRRWSRCVAPAVSRMYLEGYPRNPEGLTDHAKYASTMSNRVDMSGGSVRYAMRFPTTWEYGQGNTGNVNGWAWCNGQPTAVTRLNAWTAEPSTTCGIRAYQSGGNIQNPNGYWWIGPLAAGQCNAPSQAVNIVAHVTCGGQAMQQTRRVEIVRGKTIGAVNLYFP